MTEELKSFFILSCILFILVLGGIYSKKVQSYLKEEYKSKSVLTGRIPSRPYKYENKEGLKYRNRYYAALIFAAASIFIISNL